jgi:23S rRNA pseudouridine1911/1915/1917 synthase
MPSQSHTNSDKGPVSIKDSILEVRENSLLMQFLVRNLKHKNRDNIKSLLRNRQVWIDGQAVSQFNYGLVSGQQVVVKWNKQVNRPPDPNLKIVFEDDHIIVIDKKAGLLSISDGTDHETAYKILNRYVRQQNPLNRIFVVHRLDRDTSGLIMYAKSEKVQALLQNNWHTNVSERTYIAVVEGLVEKPQDTIRSYLFESKAYMVHSGQDPEKGELAVTHYKRIDQNKDFSLLEVSLETGKKNQIRVHMQDIGHPVTGDKKYGALQNPLKRLALHAGVLAFKHPVTGEFLRFVSKTPSGFVSLF